MADFPIEIAFHNMDSSEFVERDIREKIASLERFYDRIHHCRVAVERSTRRRNKGNIYDVHVTLGVPGRDVVVSRARPHTHAHEDINVAVRDAFRAATRRLEAHARKQRGEVKTHEAPLIGEVIRLFPEEDYGFIEMPQGLEVYFHRNSVAGDRFDELELGSEVRVVIAEGEGEKGPQASTVVPVSRSYPEAQAETPL